ncbi:methyltransferase RsmF C-terminal domain-like protein [Lacibacter sp. H407]|uniref:methyltransferase RsmF C-terminal domain-like protein n=1 Tax=Lacibacter sp. H407 TaxID=3133423 RepID=UPI0030C272CC
MQLPALLLQSIEHTKGFDKTAFEEVHTSGEQVVSVRLNPLKLSMGNEKSADFNHQELIHYSAFSIHSQVPWSSSGYYLSQRPSFTLDPLLHAGAYYVQEASSMFLEQALKQSVDLTQPLLVLDLCAAPGGKSTLLQSIISNESLLVSNEVIQTRVNILKENIIKWGAGNVMVTNNDPGSFSKLHGLFDVLVIDAPCSGSGLFRRDAEAIKEWSEDNVQLCSQRQQRILADAWNCLKEDGVLIYSTCSYSSEEDEEILDWIETNCKVESIKLEVEEEWSIDEVESTAGAYGYRFWPYKVKGEGFFIAAFRKKESPDALRLKIKNTQLASKQEAVIAVNWLKKKEGLTFIKQGQNIAAIPSQWNETIQYLMQELKVRYAGVELGTIAKNDLLPEHALAVSTILKDDVVKVELTLEQSLDYLRKNEINIDSPHKGWALAVYNNFPLGWMKLLGNRINNYYPKEWRILMR